jgi:WD40 repeat protein
LPIKFKCKHCGEVLKVSRKDAGKLGKCKKCRKPVRAPILEALPDEEPVRKYTSPRRERTGLLSELKAHPLWCVAGAFALIVLIGAVILLNVSDIDKTELSSIDPYAGRSGSTGTEYAQETGLNETDSTPKENIELESSITSRPDDNVPAANLTEEELTSLPVWAQIILNQELFPDGETWKTAEEAFEDKCSLDPSIKNNPKQLQSIEALSYRLSPLEPKDISEKYGPARIIIHEIDWYCYGLISFGKKMGDDHFSEIQAPVELFTRGFVEAAKNSGISRIASTDKLRSKVIIINSYTKIVGFSFSGCGPYFLDPNDRKVLTIPAGSYSVNVTTEDKDTVSFSAAACNGALWNIKSNPQNPELAQLFVEADQESSGTSDDSPKVDMTLVNKYTAALSIRVDYNGRYYRLKPDQQQLMRLRKKKHLVCIESEDGRSAYQIVRASENIAWDINATSDERNFCVDVNDNPTISAQLPQEDIPEQTIVSSIDPNLPVGQIKLFEGHSDTISTVSFTPDGSKILSCGGGKDKTIRLWDIATETELKCFEESQQSITKLAFCLDGRHVWSYNASDHSTHYFDLQTGDELGGFRQHICTSSTVAFSQSARHLLIADKALFLCELETGELSLSFKPNQDSNSTEQIKEIALSPDEQYVLIGFDSGNLELWPIDKESSEVTRIHQLSGHKAWINSLDFSPDGELAVSGSGYCTRGNNPEKSLKRGLGSKPVDCTVRVWDLDSGQQKACFDGHEEPVTTVAFSPDGQRILSGGYDNTIRLWDIGSSKELLCCSEHTGPVNSVAFSPDGRLAVSASQDRTVRVWKLPEPNEVPKEDVTENEDGKDGATTPESATSKRLRSMGRLRLRRSPELTRMAPFTPTTGERTRGWFIQNGNLRVDTAGDEDFLFVMVYASPRAAKDDVPKLSIKDEKDNEVGLLYTWIDYEDYTPLRFDPRFVIVFVDENNTPVTESDPKKQTLLYDLVYGRIWSRRPEQDVLLIFKGKYGSVEGLYLDGPNIHAPLHPGRRRSGMSSPISPPGIGSSRQNIEPDSTRNSRGRSRRASPRGGTR